ncbi:TPA: hypothetical protein ACU3BK_005011, partial [Salmonella enterica]
MGNKRRICGESIATPSGKHLPDGGVTTLSSLQNPFHTPSRPDKRSAIRHDNLLRKQKPRRSGVL